MRIIKLLTAVIVYVYVYGPFLMYLQKSANHANDKHCNLHSTNVLEHFPLVSIHPWTWIQAFIKGVGELTGFVYTYLCRHEDACVTFLPLVPFEVVLILSPGTYLSHSGSDMYILGCSFSGSRPLLL